MNLPNLVKENRCDFSGIIDINTKNEGFTPDEIRLLEDPFRTISSEGTKGSLFGVFKENRQPPDIQNLKSEIGYQTQLDLIDLVAVAQQQGTKLDSSISSKISDNNFYMMGCGVFIKPNDGEKFKALKFMIKYKDQGVSTMYMLPGPETKPILEANGKLDVGIDGKVNFGFPKIPIQHAEIDGNAKIQVETNFIISFHFDLQSQKVDAFGTRTNFCKWFMYDAKDLRNDVSFFPIIRTPKAIKKLECEVSAQFEIDHPSWKHAELFKKRPICVTASI